MSMEGFPEVIAKPVAKPEPYTQIYHIEHGRSGVMHLIDAREAIARHPHEWKATPWSEKDKRAVAEAKAAEAKGKTN